MADCRLSDPGALARWLDGTLEPDLVVQVDRHLLEGCEICWSVLRFVGRLREVVGRRDETRSNVRRGRPVVLLDTDAIRRAIGMRDRAGMKRELLIEVGPWEAAIEIVIPAGRTTRRLEMVALDRTTLRPSPDRLRVSVHRGTELLTGSETDEDGRLRLDGIEDGSLRLEFSGPGVNPGPLTLDLLD